MCCAWATLEGAVVAGVADRDGWWRLRANYLVSEVDPQEGWLPVTLEEAAATRG